MGKMADKILIGGGTPCSGMGEVRRRGWFCPERTVKVERVGR